ncbi:hypothetical protein Goshw_016567, partial [Gossypium schwendimanii]|nr:hypothetical protein [Gossypium schwendimanii]
MGVVRDSAGEWLVDFTTGVEGLDFRAVEIESDDALLIEVVRNGCASNNDSSE